MLAVAATQGLIFQPTIHRTFHGRDTSSRARGRVQTLHLRHFLYLCSRPRPIRALSRRLCGIRVCMVRRLAVVGICAARSSRSPSLHTRSRTTCPGAGISHQIRWFLLEMRAKLLRGGRGGSANREKGAGNRDHKSAQHHLAVSRLRHISTRRKPLNEELR